MEKIYHRGRTILYCDYRGLDDEAFIQRLWENAKAVEALAARGEQGLLRLSDLRDIYASPEIMEAISKAAVRTKKHFKAGAVLGIRGGKKVLLDLVNRSTGLGARPFDDIEQAKDWLVEQALK
jgi:hypothetical protein